MNYWFSFFICIVLFFACEIEQTDNDVYGCCHSDAWNYDSDVTVHVDSVCIYDFVFTNPIDDTIWVSGETQTISWTGGDSNLDLTILIDDINLNRFSSIVIAENIANTGSYEWIVDSALIGNKQLSLLQDINQDDQFDTVNDLVSYSDNFSITQGLECAEGVGDDDSDGICDDEDDCVGNYDCEDICNGDATLDCLDQCNGEAVLDQCGECNGDGTSCEIAPFEFLAPMQGDSWEQGTIQTISWTGGSEFLNINRLSLGDVNTNQTQGSIDISFENTGTYSWIVDCFACLEGPKTIYIEQDLDGDGTIDIWKYSEHFNITFE